MDRTLAVIADIGVILAFVVVVIVIKKKKHWPKTTWGRKSLSWHTGYGPSLREAKART